MQVLAHQDHTQDQTCDHAGTDCQTLALEPEILVADEPVSALDVSIQAQILKLLDEIRDKMNLSMVFITHDLRVAAQVCDRIVVMQRGKLVEVGPTSTLFAQPKEPYTQELLAAVPGRDWFSKAPEAQAQVV